MAEQFSTRTKARGLGRRTSDLRDAILSAFEEADKPVTVRQMFYLLSVAGAVDKNEAGYRQAQRQLVEMRRGGTVPYGWIADYSRRSWKPDTFADMEDALRSTANFYRRAVWNRLPVYVEIWVEKDALAGVLYSVTERYDVALMPAKGYSSESFAYSSAEAIKRTGKPAVVYYLGDFDPSGWNMARNLEEKLRGFGAEITFERLAVNPEQIEAWNLPSRPTKRTDTRCREFFDTFGKGTPSVELDALHPDKLRAIVREAIERHIPAGYLDTLNAAEESERRILDRMADAAAG